MNRWSVVIPSDSEDKLDACVSSILRAHPGMDPFDIIAVTRTIKPNVVRDGLKKINLVTDPAEFKFGRRVNIGMRTAGSNDVVVMGDDAELLTPGGFDLVRAEAALRILACAVRGRVGPWWQREGNRFPVVPFVSFTCVYIPRLVYQMTGPVEESFPGYGYEDTDYCLRAQLVGITSGVCGDVIIEHGVNLKSEFLAVLGEGIVQMEDMARMAFEMKWTGGRS